MDIRLLHYQNNALSPEARWLLLQWSQEIGLEEQLACPVRGLYKRLGLTLQRGGQALAKLKMLGITTCEPVRRGRGRPISCFGISTAFRRQLADIALSDTPHQPEIEGLLSCSGTHTLEGAPDTNLMSGQARVQQLPPATRWLLAVLLAHAELPGTVGGLSYSQLRRLTGMSRSRLKSQLAKLKSLQILAHHQGGMLGTLFGTRMSSVYVLNLKHPVFSLSDCLGVELVLLSPPDIQRSNLIDGMIDAAFVAATLLTGTDDGLDQTAAILEDKTHCDKNAAFAQIKKRYHRNKQMDKVFADARGLLPSMKYIKPAVDQLMRGYQEGIVRWLEARVQCYAMRLLSRAWEPLENGRGYPDAPVESVMQDIQCDFPAIIDRPAAEEEVTDQPDPFSKLIYALAHHLAKELQHTLTIATIKNGDCDFSEGSFSLTPMQIGKVRHWNLRVYFIRTNGVAYMGSVPVSYNYVMTNFGAWLSTRKSAEV